MEALAKKDGRDEREAQLEREELALRAQLGQTREKLAGMVADLRALDRQLEALSEERKRYRLLGDACGALEGLSELGAASLFWGDRGPDAEVLRLARGRLDSFEKRVGEIEDRRQVVFDDVQQQQEATEFLEDDLLELEREREERKLEWIVERNPGELPIRVLVMPWSRGGEDDERFRKALAASLLLALLLGLVIPWIELPLPEPFEPIEVPERFTRLIRETPSSRSYLLERKGLACRN